MNREPVFKFPKKTDWAEITKVNGKDVTVFLPDAHVKVSIEIFYVEIFDTTIAIKHNENSCVC